MRSWRDAAPPLPPVLVQQVPRLPEETVERFLKREVADIADLVGPLYVMDPAIAPLHAKCGTVVGSALTVKAVPGDNRAIIAALALAGAGEVMVIDWRGYVDGCGSGAKALVAPHQKGCRGVIIDGAWRDLADAEQLGMPVFGRAEHPVSGIKSHLGEINVAINCGGVIVNPGDVVVADSSGVAVVPASYADRIADELDTVDATPLDQDIPGAVQRAEDRRVAYLDAFAAAGGIQQPLSPQPTGIATASS
jgi:regulator of RNase E activity RraA